MAINEGYRAKSLNSVSDNSIQHQSEHQSETLSEKEMRLLDQMITFGEADEFQNGNFGPR